MRHAALAVAVLFITGGRLAPSAERTTRYALILEDPPAVSRVSGRKSVQSAAVKSYREQIRVAQLSLRGELARRSLRVTGAVQTLLNAVFVDAPPSRLPELRAMSGVKYVAPLHRFKRHLNRAVQLENIPAAWTALGGTASAGAGIRIAIIDSGIDQNHPAFQDSSLTVPAGFPLCTDGAAQDCSFTNKKVIVARSYVAELAAGTAFGTDPRPDDLSPRDHVGHGTALAMITAGATNTGPTGITITGLAPKAFLGSYKVFGSPGVNDFTGGDVLIRAIEDAFNDGMDVAVLSLGSPALTGPLDTGAICGAPAGTPCDPEAQTVEAAVQQGMLICASAGNSGDSGQYVPTYNSIESPATAPSAVAAAASSNSHQFGNQVRVNGSGVPANIKNIVAMFGDGPLPSEPVTAPLADVAKLDSNGTACNALPANSLNGDFALILRTPAGCNFLDKLTNASNAGAAGVIFIQSGSNEDLFVPSGLGATTIPAVLIGSSEGTAVRTYLASHSGATATLDPNLAEVTGVTSNVIASFSSHGPSIDYLLKPDLTGVGTNVYMATQKYDPNGAMYDPSGYTAASGTSFAAPMAAGLAALVKQKYPDFTALDLKSAVVATATQDLTEGSQAADSIASGNGLLNGGNALATTVTTDPATVTFGAIGQTTTLPATRQVAIHYFGTSAATLSLSVAGDHAPSLDKSSLAFSSAGVQNINLRLSGTTPAAGIYQGALTIQGGGATVRVPYLYLVGDGVPFDLIPLFGDGFDAPAGQDLPGGLGFKIVDQYGVAVPNLTVQFSVLSGGGSVVAQDQQTDQHGAATADVLLGPTRTSQSFRAVAADLSYDFSGTARQQAAIFDGGIVNAASFQADSGIVPGSYISLFGTALCDSIGSAISLPLPLAVSETSVAFEVPSANLSLPGRLLYADPLQINVQVPWELNGQSSVQIRVNVGETTGKVTTIPIVKYAPAIYEMSEQTAAAIDENNLLIGSGNAAKRGHTVNLYANGLGAVTTSIATGDPAPAGDKTTNAVSVTVGGKTATVSFAGLAEGFPGLNQVTFVVPSDAPTGSQPVEVSVGGVSSPPVNMPVQ